MNYIILLGKVKCDMWQPLPVFQQDPNRIHYHSRYDLHPGSVVSFVLAAYLETCPFASFGALWYNSTSFGRSFALWSEHPTPQ